MRVDQRAGGGIDASPEAQRLLQDQREPRGAADDSVRPSGIIRRLPSRSGSRRRGPERRRTDALFHRAKTTSKPSSPARTRPTSPSSSSRLHRCRADRCDLSCRCPSRTVTPASANGRARLSARHVSACSRRAGRPAVRPTQDAAVAISAWTGAGTNAHGGDGAFYHRGQLVTPHTDRRGMMINSERPRTPPPARRSTWAPRRDSHGVNIETAPKNAPAAPSASTDPRSCRRGARR